MTVSLFRMAWLLLLTTVLAHPLFAQFSPGELSSSHAHLEGMNQCTSCHELGKKIDGNKCLDCHTLIRTRVSAGKGFHGSASVRNKECVACHVDHKGRSFDMIKWEGGRSSFAHDQTGFVLEGRHRTDRCESCHKPAFVKDQAVIARASEGLSLSKTYLGLSTTCQSCHFDEHRGQLDKKCTTCHDLEDWKKSAEMLFDHNKARFKLTGKHAETDCIKCHKPVADARKKPDGGTDPDYLKFTGLKFDRCTACHVDPHQGRFGQNCEKCHMPGGWQNVTISGFDHSKTGYPLTGKHLAVECDQCHKPDKTKKRVFKGLAHDECIRCHEDVHAGQLADRTDKGRCESCHQTSGFVPSLFTVDLHNHQARYKLTGAHVAVACNQCHPKSHGDDFTRLSGLPTRVDSPTVVLHFQSTRCADCHKDAHHGQFDERIREQGCESCHASVDDWKVLSFDHNRDSKFPLQGKHASVACEKCHPVRTHDAGGVFTVFKPLSVQCQSCHADIHYGQFASPSSHETTCDGCHTANGFKPSTFDHNRQSRFKLDGAHEKVPCEKCHLSVTLVNGAATKVYKPVDVRCASCHATME